MELAEKINLIISILTLFGIVFGVYLYFRKPQIQSEQFDAVIRERFENHEKSQAETINNLREIFGAKFDSLEKNINHLKDNHLHTEQMLTESIREISKSMNQNSSDIGELRGMIKTYFDRK